MVYKYIISYILFGGFMETEVIMKRQLMGGEIAQKSKNLFFSATDLERVGNVWRAKNGLSLFNKGQWFASKATQDFIKTLEDKYGVVKINSRGRNGHTWVHPFIFIDMALAISPQLKIEVYSWIYDHLIQYRNDSGDSYKKMAGALFLKYHNKSRFPAYIESVALEIKKAMKVDTWETATEEQLKLRDKIHENISLLCDVIQLNEAVRIGIKKAIDIK